MTAPFPRLPSLLLAATLTAALALVGCSSDGPGDDAAGAGIKADEAVCSGAALDASGACRYPGGDAAPEGCCESIDVACAALEDHLAATCDAERADEWAGCFAAAGVTTRFAATCCAGGDDAFLWCDAI